MRSVSVVDNSYSLGQCMEQKQHTKHAEFILVRLTRTLWGSLVTWSWSHSASQSQESLALPESSNLYQWMYESLLQCFISRLLQGFQRLVLMNIFKIIKNFRSVASSGHDDCREKQNKQAQFHVGSEETCTTRNVRLFGKAQLGIALNEIGCVQSFYTTPELKMKWSSCFKLVLDSLFKMLISALIT